MSKKKIVKSSGWIDKVKYGDLVIVRSEEGEYFSELVKKVTKTSLFLGNLDENFVEFSKSDYLALETYILVKLVEPTEDNLKLLYDD